MMAKPQEYSSPLIDWLAEVNSTLSKEIQQAQVAILPDDWANLLILAAQDKPVTSLLQQSTLTLADVSTLFNLTLTLLPEEAPLMADLLQVQNRILAGWVAHQNRLSVQNLSAPLDQSPLSVNHPTVSDSDLLEQVQRRLAEVSAFFTLSQQLTTTLNLDDLLTHIVTLLQQVADCRACVLFLLNDSKTHLEIKAAQGLKTHWKNTARLAVGEGAAGAAIKHKKNIYISDTMNDDRYVFFDRSVRSIIVVPLIVQDEVIGAINLDDSTPNAFGPDQERLLMMAASQAAIAIENATLFQKVLSEEQRTKAIIDHMADGLLVINRQGDIVNANPPLIKLLGISKEAVIKENIHADTLDPRLAAICHSPDSAGQPSEAEDTAQEDYEVTLPGDSPAILRIKPTVLLDNQHRPQGEIRVVHDVTQERELENMKDDLISTVSHELRTPLFSIQGFVSLILEGEVEDPEKQQHFLKVIQRQANQLTNLVNNMLDLNKISAGTLEISQMPLQIITLLEQTLTKLEGFSQKERVALVSNLPDTLPQIKGDAQRLEQVITNLVGNAIKFTPAEGQVSVAAYQQDGHIVITVKDTGVGIPAEDLEKIFSKYYQSGRGQRLTRGTGLGLHISKQLIEKHQGKIWAESPPQSGSTFFVQLPLLNNKTP